MCVLVYVYLSVLVFIYLMASLLGASLFWQPVRCYLNVVCMSQFFSLIVKAWNALCLFCE